MLADWLSTGHRLEQTLGQFGMAQLAEEVSNDGNLVASFDGKDIGVVLDAGVAPNTNICGATSVLVDSACRL